MGKAKAPAKGRKREPEDKKNKKKKNGSKGVFPTGNCLGWVVRITQEERGGEGVRSEGGRAGKIGRTHSAAAHAQVVVALWVDKGGELVVLPSRLGGRGKRSAQGMDSSTTAQLAAAMIRSGLLSAQFESLRTLEVTNSSPGFVSDLARVFLSDSTFRIQRMEEIAGAGGQDAPELRRLVNQMVGSCDTFGAAGVAARCKGLLDALTGRLECAELLVQVERIRGELLQLQPLLELYVTLDGREEASGGTPSEGSAISGDSEVHLDDPSASDGFETR